MKKPWILWSAPLFIVIACAVAYGFYIHRWKVSEFVPQKGIEVAGNPSTPRTNKLPILLQKRSWEVVTFEVANLPADGYLVGFRLAAGGSKICQRPSKGNQFAVRIGHEDCTFFVVDRRGLEIEITKVDQLSYRDFKKWHPSTPLY